SPRPAGAPRPPRHAAREREVRRNRVVATVGGVLALTLLATFCSKVTSSDKSTRSSSTRNGASSTPGSGTAAGTTASTPTTSSGLAPKPAVAYAGWVDPKSSGQPWSSTVKGQLTFRGNPTRSYYGLGPVPKQPKVLWSFPGSGGMCGNSPVGGQNKVWCGTGWTGQPAVWEKDGKTWVAFGAYDKAVHFLDANTGQRLIDDFPVGDIIKGTVTVDPDGYPLLYTGSRDDYYHAVALDRGPQPTQLWKVWSDQYQTHVWNNDWDGSGLVIDDYLFEGGENSYFHIFKLNRNKGPDGKVTLDPKLVFMAPGFDAELMSKLPDKDVSIENSVAISGNTVYFANSGGLVQGWDISGLKQGKVPTRVFRFWTGDDTDASVVIDKEGYLYVASEYERASTASRSNEVGQIMKLDPRKPDAPLVWSVKENQSRPGGVWGTPAIANGVLYADTDAGRVLGIDMQTGQVIWEKKLPGPTWQSPVVVDGVLIQGDCNGVLHGYDVSNPRVDPKELWTVDLGGCIESTPTVWQGRIYVGTRGGKFFALGDA
ncbi:MAG: hypothetical protein JWM05_1703, partial [Acidimicrobiales bacterium]|nr:hypothetical protein [Acidimicrobiales bacterium]